MEDVVTHIWRRGGAVVACAALAAASGCGFMGVSLDRHGLRVVASEPEPAVVVVEQPAPVVAQPAPVVVGPGPAVESEPAAAPAVPAMPMVGGQAVKLPVEKRDVRWRRFMMRPPVKMRKPFLGSRIELGPEYATMMAMAGLQPGQVHFTVQHVLANFLLMADVSPAFTITKWSAGANEVSVAVTAGGQVMVFTFRYDPARGVSRVFVTMNGETVDAWPIVFSMGLAVQ